MTLYLCGFVSICGVRSCTFTDGVATDFALCTIQLHLRTEISQDKRVSRRRRLDQESRSF